MEYIHKTNEKWNPPFNTELVDAQVEKWTQAANMELWKDRVAGIEDDHIRLCTTVILENQRLYNAAAGYDAERSELLYQIILNVFPNLVIHKLISVQPMLRPTDKAVMHEGMKVMKDENGKPIEDKHQVVRRSNGVETVESEYTTTRTYLPLHNEELTAKTRIVRLTAPMALSNIALLCSELKQSIEREVLKDLWNNVGTVSTQADKEGDDFYDKYVAYVPSLSGVLHRKTLIYDKYWIVTNRSNYWTYKKQFDHWNNYSSLYYKSLHIVDHWNEDNAVLMGAYGNKFWQRGYVWAPYIFLSGINEEDGKLQIFTRYDKKLNKEGSRHFGKLIKKEEVPA